jgi:hypothetical protein
MVGVALMGMDAAVREGRRMPRSARDAALETFASLARTRHPGIAVVPLRRVGPDGAVVAASAGQVVWPFAAPEDRDPVLDGDARVGSAHDDRVD